MSSVAPWEKEEYITKTDDVSEQQMLMEQVKPQEQLMIQEAGTLTAEEKQQITDFAKSINLHDTKQIIEFGSGVQKKMSDFSETMLQSVKTKDLGEVGGLLAGVVGELKEFDPNEQEQKSGGLFGLFKKQEKKMTTLKAGYDQAAKSVDNVAAALKQHQIKLMKDVDIMDKMYESNLTYYHDLNMYILAGKQKMEMVKVQELAQAKEQAERTQLPEDVQAAKDIEDQLLRFEKKIHDLELTRMIAIQTAPQIRMIQNNDTMMVEKIQSTIVNTIPLWKNQMVLAMGLNDSVRAAQAQAAVTDMTNQLLMKNAETLKQSTIATAKASERGIVDMETLKKTNESLISTLDEVAKIQSDGRAARAQAETELQTLENNLKAKMLEMSNRG